MTQGVSEVLSAESFEGGLIPRLFASTSTRRPVQQRVKPKTVGVMGSRRIFPPAFKLKVLDSYRTDAECRGNQRATARKYGIHRRQIQKWLQCEDILRRGCFAENARREKTVPKNDASPPYLKHAQYPNYAAPNWNPSEPGYPTIKCEPQVPEDRSRYQNLPLESGLRVKLEQEEEDTRMEEEEALSSETERRSPADMSPLTSQPLSPQAGARSNSSLDSDAECSRSSSGSSSQMPRRRAFPLQFKVNVMDAYYQDPDVSGNQRATAKKYNVNRRQVQKWLRQETDIRDETTLRGGMSRQRLGTVQELESPVDLRTRSSSAKDQSASKVGSNYFFSCCASGKVERPVYCYSPNECLPGNLGCNAGYCCYEAPFSPSVQQENWPPQEAPLCLVKSKRDAILFKPYLDNPISRPGEDRGNNNNCKAACNLNEANKEGEFALIDLQVPASWPSQAPPSYVDSQVKSAFVRYPSRSLFK